MGHIGPQATYIEKPKLGKSPSTSVVWIQSEGINKRSPGASLARNKVKPVRETTS